jgi:hypothetical protein
MNSEKCWSVLQGLADTLTIRKAALDLALATRDLALYRAVVTGDDAYILDAFEQTLIDALSRLAELQSLDRTELIESRIAGVERTILTCISLRDRAKTIDAYPIKHSTEDLLRGINLLVGELADML